MGENHTGTIFVECFESCMSQRKVPVHYCYHPFITDILVEAGIPAARTTALQRRYPALPAAFLGAGHELYKQELEKEIRKSQMMMMMRTQVYGEIRNQSKLLVGGDDLGEM